MKGANQKLDRMPRNSDDASDGRWMANGDGRTDGRKDGWGVMCTHAPPPACRTPKWSGSSRVHIGVVVVGRGRVMWKRQLILLTFSIRPKIALRGRAYGRRHGNDRKRKAEEHKGGSGVLGW